VTLSRCAPTRLQFFGYIFLLAFYVAGGLAQGTNASITGIVTDVQKAAILGAQVLAINEDTGVRYDAQTNTSGIYLLPSLPAGNYRVEVQSPNFASIVRPGLTLHVQEVAAMNFELAIGSTSETVTVTGAAVLLDTQTSAAGTVIDNKKIVELPLSNRQFYSLALLSPAAYPPAQNSTLGYRGGFNVAGATETSNNVTIDGAFANDIAIGGPNFRPSIEDIQEFKLLTGAYPAEFGHNSGGQLVIVTKSGTNRFHGSAYEFIRNQVTDARPFFGAVGTTNPAFRQNTFGGTIGGPIRHDKTFFFEAYEGQRIGQQITAASTVPTTAMLGGLFAIPTQLYNPFTGQALMKNANGAYNLATIPQWTSASAQLGQAIAEAYPAPTNNNAVGGVPSSNYLFSRTRTEQMNENSFRIDNTFSAKDSIDVSYDYFHDPSFEPSNSLCGSSTLPGFGCASTIGSQMAIVNWNHIITPQLFNQVTLSWSLAQQVRVQEDNAETIFSGIPGAFNDPSISNNRGYPSTSVTSYTSLGSGTSIPSNRADNHYQIVDSVTWNFHKHTIKAGLDLLAYKDSFLILANGRGTLSFNTSSLQAVNKSGASWDHLGTTGYALADLLLGLPYTTSRNPTAPKFHERANYYDFFVQDDWQINPYLTLNFGVRYEYDEPERDAHFGLSNFSLATGTIVVMGQNGAPVHLYNDDDNNFAPRFGFAWQPYKNPHTVVKGGFGTSYNPPAFINAFLGENEQQPFRNPQTFTASAYSVNPAQSLSISLANAFPAALAGTSSTASGVDRNYRLAYINGWTLGVQQALTKSMLLDITYYGSKGTKLPMQYQANQARIPNSQTSRPFPTYSNISYAISEGSSEYHSLQTKLVQEYKNGVSFLLAYTFGKSIDGTPGLGSTSQSSSSSPQNSNNLRAERGLSDFDVRHHIVFSPVAKLPFGKDSLFLNSGRVAPIVGGFQLSGIFTYQTGRPFTVSNSATNNSGSFNNGDRPNLIGDPNAPVDSLTGAKTHTVAEWFNVNAFASAPGGSFGNAGRNVVIGPANVAIDATLARAFKIRDRLNLQFRLESFNLLNHPNFLNPYSSAVSFGSSTFGQIQQTNNGRELQGALRITF
jgi:hypothetical protein